MVLPRPPRIKVLPPEDPPAELPVGSTYRAVLRTIPYLLWTFALIPLQAIALLFRMRAAERIPMLYHRGCCRMLGLRVKVAGERAPDRPMLFIGNHSSYLDITVFGSLLPASFVAKAEIAGWPLFGTLAKLQRSVFVDRRMQSTQRQRDEIAERLEAGDNLILFPEGTSNDGNAVLPFRSALLSVAERKIGPEQRPLKLQPISIAYTGLNGVPLGYGLRPLVAWYGDMDLASHLWQLLGLGRIEVKVIFHPPVTIEAFGSRKALTDHCFRDVAAGVAAAIAGRPQTMPAAPARGVKPIPQATPA
ncbi:MAG: lysophospholipid acyltransferase family protein [Dongiaceae bacterium]